MFQSFKTFYSRFSLKLGIVLAGAMIFSHAAMAQFAATPCDPNYYDSLEARAWLEAQREITQNQNLIFKPDSVLEYTCFDGHLAELAQHAEDMFSETDRWGASVLTQPVAQNIHMDNALVVLVADAFDAYDAANFGYAGLLGNRIRAVSPWVGTAPTSANPTYGYNYSSPGGGNSIGGTYACDIMQAVWQKAKCMNFVDSTGNDGFFTFDQYANSADKRWRPTRCTAIQATWQTNIDNALPPIGATTPWDFDDVVTFLPNLFPTAAGCGSATLNRVRTGLVVRQTNAASGPRFFQEHVCLVPGCHWVPTGTGTAASPATTGNCTYP